MERWVGRVAVVTGASAGIGAAVAVSLADAGLKVVGLARRPHLVHELNSKVTGLGRIISRKCDVSNAEEVAETFNYIDEDLGGTDLLVNNAGVFFTGHITELGNQPLTDAQIVATIDVNVKAPVLCARRAVASMKRRGFGGHIININSVTGHCVPSESLFNIYPGTKHAITALTQSLGNEIASCGSSIKTTSLSPGLVNTDLGAEAAAVLPSLDPQAVADAVLYVVSTPPGVKITEMTITDVLQKGM